MSEPKTQAGQVFTGKDGHREDEPTVLAKQAKLVRMAKEDSDSLSVATKCDDTVKQDEFFNDALARFGIKI